MTSLDIPHGGVSEGVGLAILDLALAFGFSFGMFLSYIGL
jgi:hypothetical protein